MVEHLKRHGATVDALRIEEVRRGTIADRLQSEAQALGADLIVAGVRTDSSIGTKRAGPAGHEQELLGKYPPEGGACAMEK